MAFLTFNHDYIMFNKIIRFSIRNKLIIGLFTIFLIFWGVYALTRLPIDAVPDITNNQVQVITSAPSQSATDIERIVTFPIEQSVATIPGIVEVRSFSRFGLSVVTIVFKDDIDVYLARQQVTERLTEAKTQIPEGIGTPELAPVTTGLGEIYQYVVHTKKGYEKKYTPMDLRTIQDWVVRRQLLGVEGIADVSSFGGFVKQYEIAINTDRLRSMNVSIGDVFAALKKNNQNTGGSYIDRKPTSYFIRSEGLIKTTGDIENIVVKNGDDGIPVLIRNIGTVQFGHAVRYGAMTRNNDGEVVGAIVMMLKGANSSQVIENVKERIAQIEKTLPEGVVIEPFLDRTKLVNHAISTVSKNLIEGALIVIFVLVLLLGNFRAGLIVASVIPLAMLFALGLMNVFGVSGNLMSLGAIDFGLIVDGAVIIVEATMHHLANIKNKERLTQEEMNEEVFQSASKIRTAAAFGEIIILIVYLPILALAGVEGKMFKPMAQTVSFAILGAFILSLTYVPMVSALFLSRKTVHKRNISDKIMDVLNGIYEPLLKRALLWKKTVVAVAVVAFLLSFGLFTRLGAEFLPSLDEGDFAVETRVLVGSSLTETIDAAQKASDILLKKFPNEVKEVVGKIGSSEIPTDPMPVEACDLMVILKDKDNWKVASDKDELAEKMGKALEDIPGVTFGFQQPIQMRFNELMTGARQDVVIKVYGEDLDMLSDYAGDVASIASGIEGAKDMYVEKATGLTQIVIKYHRDQIAKYGMNIEDVNTAINTAFAGQVAGQVYEGEKRFDLAIRLEKGERVKIENVKNMNISSVKGQQVPLSQLADISFVVGPNQIQRDDTKRRIIIGFNVRGRDVESIVEELQRKVNSKIKLAPGYSISYGGTFENLQQARARLSIAVPVALLLIFVLLYVTFGSIRQGILIYTAIPLSAIGGICALWFRGMPFSISAGIGFIALFGVAVLNGIVMISEFNRRKKNGETDLVQIILQGTKDRLRPVVMTATVASLGFLPMALSGGSGAEVQKPLATVVIGGLITATLLTLFVLPCLYLISEKVKRKNKRVTATVVSLLLLLFITGSLSAQQQISLDSALSVALKNNKELQATGSEVDYYRQMKKTASILPNTNVSMVYGQYNSYSGNDNNITVSQTIPFPTVFGAKAALGDAQVTGALLKTAVTKNDLILQIKQTYFRLLYLQSFKRLLLQQDSLYADFVRAADIKFKTGESTFLEKSNATTRLAASKFELRQNEADIKSTEQLLQSLLFVEYQVTAIPLYLPQLSLTPVGESVREGNPQLKYLKQQVTISEKYTNLAKQNKLPDITVGYFNQTLIGTPMNETGKPLAIASNRFQGLQVGVGIPLIAQRAKVRAEQAKQEAASLTYQANVTAVQGLYQQRLQQALSQQENLEYFRITGLANADLLAVQSQKSYKAGEIGYAEFLLNQQQAYTIRQQYLKVLYNYDIAVLELEALSGSNL